MNKNKLIKLAVKVSEFALQLAKEELVEDDTEKKGSKNKDEDKQRKIESSSESTRQDRN